MITQEQRDIMYKGLAITGRISFDADEYRKIEADLERPKGLFPLVRKGVMAPDLDIAIQSFSMACLSARFLRTRSNRARNICLRGGMWKHWQISPYRRCLIQIDGWKWHFYV